MPSTGKGATPKDDSDGFEQKRLEDMKAAKWTSRTPLVQMESEVPKGILVDKGIDDVPRLGFDLYDASQNYSVDYLFGGLDGAPLIDKIMEFFVVEEKDTLPWFFEDASGTMCRSIIRSPLSRPIQERTVARYKQRVLQEGLSQRVAGWQMGFHSCHTHTHTRCHPNHPKYHYYFCAKF